MPTKVPNTEERKTRLKNKDGGIVYNGEKSDNLGMDLESKIFVFKYLNTKQWRQAEIFSAGLQATARGVAKLGSYMANKGTSEYKTIMSVDSWDRFHANPVTEKDQLIGMEFVFMNGGVTKFGQSKLGGDIA